MLLAALLAALAVLASSQQLVQAHAEPVSVELRSLSADIADVYDWSVTSSLLTSPNLTLSGNSTSTAAGFQLDIRRKPAGSAHTVAGTVIATNPAENPQPVTVEAFRVTLSTGDLFFGSSTRTLSCRGGSLGPGEVLLCDFSVPASSSVKSITPSVVLRGAPAEAGDSFPVTFSSKAADGETDATADGSSSSSSSSNLGCATVKDSVHAAGAQQGFSVAASTNADGNQLLDGGVNICQEAATLRFTMKVGPFTEACGTFMFSDKPVVEPRGGGSVSVTPASGMLTITDCRQKDVLGLLKPSATLSQVTVGKATSYIWTASAGTSVAVAPAAGSGVASAAAPVAGLEAAAAGEALVADGGAGVGEAATSGLLAASAVPYTATLAVQSVLNLSRSSASGGQPSNSLVGEVTITNTQAVPYILAGGRVAVTPSRSSSSRTAQQQQAAASQPTQIFGNLSCPLGAAGSIMVPPQIMGNLPGTLRCTFDLPVNSSMTSGSVQAQLKTLLSSTFEVDSGAPVPFTLSGNATAMEVGGCVNVWAQRITDVAAVSAEERAANRDLDAILQQVEAQGLRLASAPATVRGWVPPAPNGLLSLPMSVCGNKSVVWTDVNGPFESPRDCGRSLAVMAVTIKPKSGSQKPIYTALAYPLVVTGCGLVPSLAVDELRLAAKKSYSWCLDKVATPAGGLALKYDQQDFIKYDVSYNQSSQVSAHRLQALVRLSNPHASPVTVTQVSFSVSRPGQPPLTGTAVCRADAAAAAQAALDARASGASSLRQPPHVLQASPAAVAAAQASAAAAAAASKASTANLFGGLFAPARPTPSKPSGSRTLLNAASAKQAVAEPAADSTAEQAAAEQAQPEQQQLLDATGPPLFCSFALPLPDSFASEVTVSALTDAGEEATAGPLALDWGTAAMEEAGKCALLSAAFQQTQPASLLQPTSVVGTMPPVVKVCEPTRYSFKALFGPFNETQCGEQQAILNVAVALPGSSSAAANDDAISRLNITGCPDAMPLVTLAPPVPAEITTSYAWSIERSLQPLEPAGAPAAVSGAGSRMASPAAVVVEAPGGLALFKQTVVFRRGEAVQHGKDGQPRAFQVKGTVSLVNPADSPLQLSEVQVKITQKQPKGGAAAAGSSEPVVTVVAAGCPKEVVKVAGDAKKGKVIELPAGGASKPVVCSFGALLGQGGAAEVLAVAVMAADGRRAKSDRVYRVDFGEVKPVIAGSCVKVSETLTLVDAATGQALPAPPSIGTKLPAPSAPDTLCATKTFSMFGQVGPLPKAAAGGGARLAGGADAAGSGGNTAAEQQAATGCGALSLISSVVAEPTNGYQGKLLSNGRFDVRFEGCKQA